MPAAPLPLVLGGGCFWCLEAAFRLLPGVTRVTCGYAGGTVAAPTYEQVYTDTTGHAEVVQLEYDPARLTLAGLLAYFWQSHDPTQADGQGGDLGTRYRSVIFFADASQQAAAESSRAAAQAGLNAPITTQILPLREFWPAEAYHQDYFTRHPERAYCATVIRPKLKKLQSHLTPGA